MSARNTQTWFYCNPWIKLLQCTISLLLTGSLSDLAYTRFSHRTLFCYADFTVFMFRRSYILHIALREVDELTVSPVPHLEVLRAPPFVCIHKYYWIFTQILIVFFVTHAHTTVVRLLWTQGQYWRPWQYARAVFLLGINKTDIKMKTSGLQNRR